MYQGLGNEVGHITRDSGHGELSSSFPVLPHTCISFFPFQYLLRLPNPVHDGNHQYVLRDHAGAKGELELRTNQCSTLGPMSKPNRNA